MKPFLPFLIDEKQILFIESYRPVDDIVSGF